MNLKNIIIVFVILILLSGVASATDWTISNIVGIGHTNYISDQFVITNNNASNGYVRSINLLNDGSYTSTDIFQNCNNCLYGMINPIDNTRWGTDEAGNIFYTTQITPVDYSLGFYTAGVTGACYSAGGNCNNLHKVETLVATTYNRKMAFDSSGNVYVGNFSNIKKYIRSLGYSPQSFYTFVQNQDYTPASAGTDVVDVIDMKIDSTDTFHVLLGSSSVVAGAHTGYLSKTTISSSGVFLYSDKSLLSDTAGAATAGYGRGGGLVIDSVNPTYNYTYGAKGIATTDAYIKHNSTDGTVDVVGGPIVGVTDFHAMGYNNFQVYASFPASNLIRSYVTNFEGYGFSQVPTNPDGLTGTFSWLNGYGSSVTIITPGAALAYRWTISDELSNYTFFSGWSTNTQTEPSNLHDLTNLGGLGKPAVFPTSSNDLAGTSIYGYLLARRNNDSSWSMLTNPQILTISPASVGFDSITLDKTFYNLTGDTISATFTYSSGYPPYFYQWQLCSRADCADGSIFNLKSLIGESSTSSMATDGLKEGNYYAVMMRHLPFLSNEIVASQKLEIRPPVIGLSWDKPKYNLLPKSTISTCLDTTPTTNYIMFISGYGGLYGGWFSCNNTSPDANANNSIMRASLYARYNSTFYLNNSLGSIWSETLNNSSAVLIYSLTNSSVTETWTLTGINESGEVFYANTEVEPESAFAYSISVSPNPAYNTDTLTLTFTKPIYKLLDYVIVMDAGGQNVVSFKTTDKSGSYYIDPAKKYTYGTWTAYWVFGSQNKLFNTDTTVFNFVVKNAGKPTTNGSITPENSAEYTSTEITNLLSSKIFWALLFIIGIMITISTRERRDP